MWSIISCIKVFEVSPLSVKNLICFSKYLTNLISLWHSFSWGLFISFHIAANISPGLFSTWELLMDAQMFCMCEFLSFLIDFQILQKHWEVSALWVIAFLIFNSWYCSISDYMFSDNSSSYHFFSLGMCFFPHSIITSHTAFHISLIFACVRLYAIAENLFSTLIM